MEAGVQAQPEAANNTLLVGKTPWYTEINNNLNWERPVELTVFQTNGSGAFQGNHLYIWYLFNHSLWFSRFSKDLKDVKTIILQKPCKDTKFSPNLRPLSMLATTGKLFEKVILKIAQNHIGWETCLMQISLVSVHGITQHWNLWDFRSTWP
jgi:hypothetical protein